MTPPKIRRQDLPKDANLCEYCTAKCCRYFALPIETPTDLDDFNNIRWYMLHGRINVFVEDGDWYLLVLGDCQHLLPDNRCGIYEDRPTVCRTYTTDDCEFEDDAVYDKFFETPEQMWEDAEAVLGPAGLIDDAIVAMLALNRVVKAMGQAGEDVLRQYLETVRPMHLEFVEPSKRWADIIIPEGGENRMALEMVIAHVQQLLGGR